MATEKTIKEHDLKHVKKSNKRQATLALNRIKNQVRILEEYIMFQCQ